MQLSPDQSQALNQIRDFLKSNQTTLALAGAAGTGKTTVVSKLVSRTVDPIRFTATTNKAAGVAAAMLGGTPCPTVHKVFGLAPVRTYNGAGHILKEKNNPKYEPGDTILIDESSMVDLQMLEIITRHAEANRLKVLFIGDPYQLPPVSKDKADATPPVFESTKTIELTKVHRQAEASPVLSLATQIRHSMDGARFPKIESSPCGAVKVFDYDNPSSRTEMNGILKEMLTSDDYARDPDYMRMLAWTNRQVNYLNQVARSILLGKDAKHRFVPGERVMSNKALFLPKKKPEHEDDPWADDLMPEDDDRKTLVVSPDRWLEVVRADFERRDYGVATVAGTKLVVENDEGSEYSFFVPSDWKAAKVVLGAFASKAARLSKERAANKHKVSAKEVFDAWQKFYDTEDLFGDIRPPHAQTVHKSQGSSYRHSVIWMSDVANAAEADSARMFARLLYVAVTRASESVLFSGMHK